MATAAQNSWRVAGRHTPPSTSGSVGPCRKHSAHIAGRQLALVTGRAGRNGGCGGVCLQDDSSVPQPPPGWRRITRRLGVAALAALGSLALLRSVAWAEEATTGATQGLELAYVLKIFLAGGTGCSLSHAVATPFDVVKTRQQSDPLRYSHNGTGQPLGARAVGRQIVREEGLWTLLQGMGPTCVGYGVQGAVKYGLWEVFRVIFGFASATGCVKVLILVAAAFVAEIFASALLCPFERLRIRLVADPNFSNASLSHLTKALSRDGFRKTLYGKGLGSMLIKQTAYTIAKLTVFTLISDSLRYHWSDACSSASKNFLYSRMAITLLASVMAGLVAGIASQPGDTLMTCMSTDSTLRRACPVDLKTGAPPGTLQMALALGREGLFTGWRARLVHVEVIVVTQLFIYDAIKHALGL